MATEVIRSPRSGQLPIQKRPLLSEIVNTGSGYPNRYILHAVEGWGKTSLGAYAPKPLFLQTKGETGLETLIDAGQLPEVPHFPEIQDWNTLLGCIDTLIEDPHEYRTLALDTLNGAERLCHEHVCKMHFANDWTDKGFMGYMRGFEVSLADWREFLSRLDRLRAERRMTIMLLCHTKVGTFKNPEGPDYDRYQPDCNAKTWALTAKWADVVLFGNFEVTVDTEKANARKGKGKGGQQRMMYCERHASYDAKNRIGLPPEIEMGSNPAEGWQAFISAVKAGREQGIGVQSNG